MTNGMDIIFFKIDLEGGSTDGRDDIIFWEFCFEVGITDHGTNHSRPDFSLLEAHRDFDLVVVSIRVHMMYDDACIFAQTSHAMIGPRNDRSAIDTRFNGIIVFEIVAFSCREFDREIATNNFRHSCFCHEKWLDRIVCMDRLIVRICTVSKYEKKSYEQSSN